MNCPIDAKQASFRGVEFHYESGSIQGGRRGATHEYPFREDHYDQDLGKMAPRFNVSGYVTAPNVRDKLRTLEQAFNAPGHGVYYDAWANREFLVRCESFSIDLSRFDLQRGTFTASFVERGAEPAPSALRRAIAQLNSALATFNDALATGYGLINGTVNSVQNAIAGFQMGGSYLGLSHRRHFATSDDVVVTQDALDIATPFSGGQLAVEDAVDAILAAQSDEQQLGFLNMLANIEGSGVPDVANQALIYGGVGLARYAELIISQDYTDRQTAVAEINEFVRTVRRFMGIAEAAGLPDLAKEALCLASLAGDRVTTELGDVPVVQYVDGAGKPALVLSFDLYRDIDEAKRLMASNCIVSGASVQGEVGYVISNSA